MPHDVVRQLSTVFWARKELIGDTDGEVNFQIQ